MVVERGSEDKAGLVVGRVAGLRMRVGRVLRVEGSR